MLQVYSAQHPTEAYIVKGLLETRGIECQVRGDLLFSARGEIPITQETAPSVWIKEDQRFNEARKIVKEYEKANSGEISTKEKWTCQSCNEISEGQFTHCWQCGTAR